MDDIDVLRKIRELVENMQKLNKKALEILKKDLSHQYKLTEVLGKKFYVVKICTDEIRSQLDSSIEYLNKRNDHKKIRTEQPLTQPPEPTLRATHPVQENFLERAKVAYEDLLKGHKPLSLDLLYLEFDTNRTPGSELEEERISLKVTCSLQSPFVLFCERSSEGGWLFPNPTRLYTEDMGRVFTGLTREHISQQKQNIIPVEVQKVGNGRWQVV